MRFSRILTIIAITVLAATYVASEFMVLPYQSLAESRSTGIVIDSGREWQDKVRYTVKADGERIWLNVPLQIDLRYGDRISFTPSCDSEPEGSFNRYRMLKKVTSICTAYDVTVMRSGQGSMTMQGVSGIRDFVIARFDRLLPEPYSSFIRGLIIGGTGGMPQNIVDHFKRTGTTHIVAVSGYNVSIVIGIIVTLLSSVAHSRRVLFCITTAFLFVFLLVTGLEASILRAVVMGWIWLAAQTSGVSVNARNLVLLTAVGMALINPYIVRYDIGFQLSFIATLGLMFITPRISALLPALKGFAGTAVNGWVVPSVIAYLCTLPILWFHFGQLSLTAPVVNILIAPLIPPAMLFGALLFIFGSVPILSVMFQLTAWLFLHGIIAVVAHGSSFSWSLVRVGDPNAFIILVAYAGLCLIAAYGYTRYMCGARRSGELH